MQCVVIQLQNVLLDNTLSAFSIRCHFRTTELRALRTLLGCEPFALLSCELALRSCANPKPCLSRMGLFLYNRLVIYVYTSRLINYLLYLSQYNRMMTAA
jgi:hypothetical protein